MDVEGAQTRKKEASNADDASMDNSVLVRKQKSAELYHASDKSSSGDEDSMNYDAGWDAEDFSAAAEMWTS